MKILLASSIVVGAAAISVPRALSVTSPPVLKATGFTLVDTSGRVRASLGLTSDGNVLTFFDSTGKKTLTLGNDPAETAAALIAWDGNKVIAGKGIPRVAVAESNPSVGPSNGFGLALNDSSGNSRTGLYLTFDGSSGGMYANASNGSSTGVYTSSSDGNLGFYADDLHGKNRSFLGNSLDGSTYNELGLSYATGEVAGAIYQGPLNGVSGGVDLNLLEPSGRFDVGELLAGNGLGWSLRDSVSVSSSNIRMIAFFDPTTESIEEYSSAGKVVGHLP
jgi:hypothetical protein